MKVNEPKVGIIILNYVTYQLTISLVNSISSFDYKNFFVIIVDNKSPNESYIELSNYLSTNKFHFDVHFIESDKNGGYSYGNNIGAKRANELGADYTVIMNNDIEFTNNNLLKDLISPLENDDSYAIACPMIFNINQNIVEEPMLFNKRNIYYHTFDFLIYHLKRICPFLNREPKLNNNHIFMGSGSCFMVNSKFFKEIGYFDEKIFMYGEEYILGEKVYQANKKVLYIPSVKVIHKHRLTTKNFFKEIDVIRMGRKSKYYYFKKYRKINFVTLAIWNFRLWLEYDVYKFFLFKVFGKQNFLQ
jgi:GT2 family glycosyltransferase